MNMVLGLSLVLSMVTMEWAHGGEQGAAKVDTLARHETVAEFRGTNYHRCMGLTSLCPDKCGHSGALAKFKIVSYLSYEKFEEYGDPKCDESVFLVEDNMKHPKVPADVRAAVNSLKQGDIVLLSWNHDYVTSNGGSAPERPLTRLEKIAPVGTESWLNQIDRRAGVRDAAGHGPTIGSDEWMQAVSVKLGVYDKLGHGPTPDSEEWRDVIQWKAFGIKSGQFRTGIENNGAEEDKSRDAVILAEEKAVSDPSVSTVINGWVTVIPSEFEGAINNPLKGFRDYKKDGYGLVERQYIKWRDIEVCEDDSVDRIIAHTNRVTTDKGRRFEDLNVKLVPRVYLDWNGEMGSEQDPQQHWPADLHAFDYDSPAFQARLKRLVEKLGEAWDNDPRIFAVQMGLIGRFGEHHNPAPTKAQRLLLAEAFKEAFKHKPVLVRHNDAEFMHAGFGIYYDTFAYLDREPETGPKDQFPWQATHVYRDIWKRAPIEGEVEYNWQQRKDNAKAEETFGRTPDETMKVPAYRRYMIDKIRRYHASYLGWIDNYNPADAAVLAGAAELQKVFGYRFVLDFASYPLAVQPGEELKVKLTVRNTGSAPFYLDWPVAVALLDLSTKKPVWSAPLNQVDIRRWLPGEDWDSEAFAYRRPAEPHHEEGHATVPQDIKPGQYFLALAILDRQGGMMPSVRFAMVNYFRGGWHPLGFIGIGAAPADPALKNIPFDNPAIDESLFYKVPEELRAVKAPPIPQVKAVQPWKPDPKQELINPWRYWTLEGESESLHKQILNDGPVEGPAGCRVIRVAGDFGQGSSLNHALGRGIKLDRGRYHFAFRVRGTPGQSVEFQLADGWRKVSTVAEIPLTAEWQEHIVDFEITNSFKDETTLRFSLPRNANGTFDLTDTRLKRGE